MPKSWNFFDKQSNTDLDIDLLKKEVAQRFPFYDMKYNTKSAAFFCRIDKERLEEKFEDLRKSLSKKGYIPMLRYEKGEDIIYILKKPKKKEKPVWVNMVLLLAVIITTVLTGSMLYQGSFDIYSMKNPMDILNPENLLFGGLLFALPLMSILFIHEMGHYFISRKHNISTSFPFFIPVPPVLPYFNIGTFGAIISSNEPMPDKKSLFDVGFSGPLAGFLVAIPVTIIGISTAEIVPQIAIDEISAGTTVFGSSLLIDILVKLIHNLPSNLTIDMNPILFAGWVGLLITSINLLPAGQLDGGHIFRSVLGDKQKYLAWAAIIIMVFTGWWFFAFIIIFMMGTSHPPPLNDNTTLDTKRKILFILAVAILLLCFIPFPIYSL